MKFFSYLQIFQIPRQSPSNFPQPVPQSEFHKVLSYYRICVTLNKRWNIGSDHEVNCEREWKLERNVLQNTIIEST